VKTAHNLSPPRFLPAANALGSIGINLLDAAMPYVGPADTTGCPAAKAALPRKQADAAIADAGRCALRDTPPLRPVLFLAGYRGPHFQSVGLQQSLSRLSPVLALRSLCVSFQSAITIEAMCDTVAEAAAEWGAQDAASQAMGWDAVAISGGGLVAKSLAADGRVKISRLVTFASPHAGSIIADFVRPDPAAACMRTGSPYLADLHRRWMTYAKGADAELHCLTSTRDGWVGADRAWPNPALLHEWPAGDATLGPRDTVTCTRGRLIGSHWLVSHEPGLLLAAAQRLGLITQVH